MNQPVPTRPGRLKRLENSVKYVFIQGIKNVIIYHKYQLDVIELYLIFKYSYPSDSSRATFHPSGEKLDIFCNFFFNFMKIYRYLCCVIIEVNPPYINGVYITKTIAIVV